jgi:hypothetical protein
MDFIQKVVVQSGNRFVEVSIRRQQVGGAEGGYGMVK